MRTGIILVGGQAVRAQGREKYFFLHQGKTFLSRLLESISPVTDEIILVARDPVQCERFRDYPEVICVTDIRKGIGPIGGIHAGILAAKGDLVFISGCDMPFVNGKIVDYLFTSIGDYDAVIPTWGPEMFEPLHSVYRKKALLGYLESHESLSLRSMIRSLNVRYVNVGEFRNIDPTLKTFLNVNMLEDLSELDKNG